MTGHRLIPADRETVWKALNDPEILKASLPGCEEIVKTSDTEMTAKLTAKVGPVKAKFTGALTITDSNPPVSYTLNGEGKGGAAGFAKGGASVRLEETDGGTILHYEAKANVGGKLAQLGARLIDGTAKRMADEFFSNFAKQVSGDAAAEPQPVAPQQAAPAPAAPEPAATPPAAENAEAGSMGPSPAERRPEERQPEERQAEDRQAEERQAEERQSREEPAEDRRQEVDVESAEALEKVYGAAPERPDVPPEIDSHPQSGGVHPAIWIAGLVVLVLIVVYLVT
ncbi:MAG: carbon monoxide dehydrogenase subunit G [Azospirillaceae bacterium]